MRLTSPKSLWWVVMIVTGHIIVSGCSTAESQKPRLNALDIRRTNLYTIDISERMTACGIYAQPQGSDQLYFLDPESFLIHRLNTDNGKLDRIAQLPAIPYYEGFDVDEPRHLFFIYSDNVILTFNWKGEKVREYDLGDRAQSGFLTIINPSFLPIRKGNKLYVQYFENMPDVYKDKRFFSTPVEAELDLKSGKVKQLLQTFPANYRQNCYSYDYTADRLEMNKTTHAYAFPHNDSLFMYNWQTGEKNTIFFGSRRQKKFLYLSYNELSRLNESVFEQLIQDNSRYAFGKRYPLAGYYSRLFARKQNNPEKTREEYLVLFDQNLQYIGESEKGFQPYFLIDSRKGLLSMHLSGHNLIIDKLSW